MLCNDFKFEVECASSYLENAVRTLRILEEELSHEMVLCKKEAILTSPGRVLEFCAGFSVVEHELEHIYQELCSAVDEEYRRERETQCRE